MDTGIIGINCLNFIVFISFHVRFYIIKKIKFFVDMRKKDISFALCTDYCASDSNCVAVT